jgi:hypothetical protein
MPHSLPADPMPSRCRSPASPHRTHVVQPAVVLLRGVPKIGECACFIIKRASETRDDSRVPRWRVELAQPHGGPCVGFRDQRRCLASDCPLPWWAAVSACRLSLALAGVTIRRNEPAKPTSGPTAKSGTPLTRAWVAIPAHAFIAVVIPTGAEQMTAASPLTVGITHTSTVRPLTAVPWYRATSDPLARRLASCAERPNRVTSVGRRPTWDGRGVHERTGGHRRPTRAEFDRRRAVVGG